MITEWGMYLITRLDAFKGLLMFMTIVSILVSVIYMIVLGIEGPDSRPFKSIRPFRHGFWVFFVTIIINTLLPTTKEMAVIKVLPAIVRSENLDEIGSRAKTLFMKWADEVEKRQAGEN